jgi:anti-anti-sigma factor
MSAYELVLGTTDEPEVVVATLAGELDLTNARELEDRLSSAADPGARLVLDLNHVVFIDSAALHVLFRLARVRGRDHLTVVVEPTAAISRTLEIVGFPSAATVVASLTETHGAATQ